MPVCPCRWLDSGCVFLWLKPVGRFGICLQQTFEIFWAQWPVRIESGSPFGTLFWMMERQPRNIIQQVEVWPWVLFLGWGQPPPYNIQPGHSNSCSSLCWSNSHGVQSPMYCPLKAKKEPTRLLAFVYRYTMICNDSTLISRLRYRWHGDPCVTVRKLVALPGSCVRLSLPFPGWPNALDEGTREIRLEGPSKLIRAYSSNPLISKVQIQLKSTLWNEGSLVPFCWCFVGHVGHRVFIIAAWVTTTVVQNWKHVT